MSEPPAYPGAVAPARERTLESCGLGLKVCEWGDPAAPPLVLTHGFFDHCRAFDLLAPLLAEHFRVVAWDARGHGDSGWAGNYSWPADLLDQARILEDVGPAHLVGHSRGGGIASETAGLWPEAVRTLVLLDGFGPPPSNVVVAQNPRRPRPESPPELLEMLLDWRRKVSAMSGFRPRDSVDELARGRLTQNPRLSLEWMRYFAHHGARRVEGGFIWKVDPLAARGFGPFVPEWVDVSMARLEVPVLAVEPGAEDVWALPEPWRTERLSHVPDLERVVIPGAGHFMAIEQPRAVADAILGFVEARS